ncbi:MAG: MFS transporter [Pseudomonadota bacterium]|nr:MFS transporter [Pseudomonadota bacterium]
MHSQEQPASSAAVDDKARVGWGFITLYALAYTGTWLALLTPVLVTIALKVRHLAPQAAASNLSLVLGLGAFFALVGNPLFGRLSDRTTSRFGMRRPWLIGGVMCGAVALSMIATASSVIMVLVGWCLAQLAFNAVLAAMIAVLPDRVPAAQRGTVAGVMAICLPLGQVSGTFLVQSIAASTLLMFMVPATICVVLVLVFALALRDRRLAPGAVPSLGWRDVAAIYWVNPRQYPDFAWTWLSRLLLVLGTAFLNTYQPFYLIDKLGHTEQQIPTLIFQGILVQTVAIIAVSVLGGRLSDALGRRKIFVVLGGMVYALGLWVIAAAPDYPTFLLGMTLTGAGHGIYFAVDLALVTDVLPNRWRDAAKDLGIFNVANALPQAIAPAVAPLILAVSGGNYTLLFAVAGSISLLASITILPVKSVR